MVVIVKITIATIMMITVLTAELMMSKTQKNAHADVANCRQNGQRQSGLARHRNHCLDDTDGEKCPHRAGRVLMVPWGVRDGSCGTSITCDTEDDQRGKEPRHARQQALQAARDNFVNQQKYINEKQN